MSVEQKCEILCDACLEPKYGGVEWESLTLCFDCLKNEVLDPYGDGYSDDDEEDDDYGD